MLRISDSSPRHRYEFDIDTIYNLPSYISNCHNRNVNVTCHVRHQTHGGYSENHLLLHSSAMHNAHTVCLSVFLLNLTAKRIFFVNNIMYVVLSLRKDMFSAK